MHGEVSLEFQIGGHEGSPGSFTFAALRGKHVAREQLSFDYRNLSVNHSIEVRLTTACKSEVLCRVRE
jgi:hypothetical protein